MTNTIATIARVVTSEELDSIGKGTSSAMSMARATNAIARVVVTAMARVVLIVAVRVVSEVFAEVAATMTRIVLDKIAHGAAFMTIVATSVARFILNSIAELSASVPATADYASKVFAAGITRVIVVSISIARASVVVVVVAISIALVSVMVVVVASISIARASVVVVIVAISAETLLPVCYQRDYGLVLTEAVLRVVVIATVSTEVATTTTMSALIFEAIKSIVIEATTLVSLKWVRIVVLETSALNFVSIK